MNSVKNASTSGKERPGGRPRSAWIASCSIWKISTWFCCSVPSQLAVSIRLQRCTALLPFIVAAAKVIPKASATWIPSSGEIHSRRLACIFCTEFFLVCVSIGKDFWGGFLLEGGLFLRVVSVEPGRGVRIISALSWLMHCVLASAILF